MLRRVLCAVLLALAAAAAVLEVGSAPAGASVSDPVGGIASAQWNTFTHELVVTGWAYDKAHSSTSIEVSFNVDGQYAGHVTADRPSPNLDAYRHITGNHVFRFARIWSVKPTTIRFVPTGTRIVLDTATATYYSPGPGERIITVAKRYVGYPYVEGGGSPSGFDCSGYTKYVYAEAHVHYLPHNAEGQRTWTGMRRIYPSSARPGDLVFYMSGGTAYHVAIYAGHGMQYAAATVRDGVRYQAVWSTAVQYRTDWH